MRKGGVTLLAVLLAAGAVWWLLDGGTGDSGTVDSYDAGGPAEGAGPGLEGRESAPGADSSSQLPAAPAVTDDAPRGFDGIVLVGRVVDSRRAPIAGARVEGRFPDRSPLETRSDERGRFRLSVGARPTTFVVGTLRAFAEDGRLGVGPVSLQTQGTDTHEVAAIVVGASFSFDVRVEAAGVPRAGARVVVAQQIWSRMTPIAEGTTDAAGVFRAERIPSGSVRVFAALSEHGRNHIGLQLPRTDPDPVVLELLEERPLTVRVVDKATQTPVEGARVNVGDRYSARTGDGLRLLPALEAPLTDAQGRAQIATLNARDEYFVSAEAEGYAPPTTLTGLHTPVPEGALEVTHALGTFRTLRFPIEPGEMGVPADGTSLELETLAWMKPAFDPEADARIEGGRLIVRGLPGAWANGRVVTLEGAFAVFMAPRGNAEPSAVTFKRGLEARVRIDERGRGPLPGARLTWKGGFQFGERQEVVTDAAGEAILRGMSAGRITVILLSGGEAWRGVTAGRIDLTPANIDALHVLEVEPERTLTIQVTLDGEPGLPGAYQLRIGKRVVAPGEIEEDAEAGILRVETRASGAQTSLPVEVRARGYATGTAVRSGARDETVSVALRLSARLLVRVEPPDDGDFSLAVERFDPQSERWVNARATRAEGDTGAGGGRQEASEHVFLVAEAGRFRVRDAVSDTYSEPVDLALGYDAETGLDLSRTAWIHVQVEPADTADIARARVFRTDVEPDDRLGRNRGVPVDGRGRAKVRARRGARCSLSVRHPLLAAAGDGGTVNATAGSAKRVVLRLEQGSLLTFRLGSGATSPTERRAATVFLAPNGAFGSAQVFRGVTVLDQGLHQLGGFAPGVYTIWIDAFRGAPIVLESRELSAGTTRLGLLTPPPGASLRVKIQADSGATTPLLWVVVRRQGAPPFDRGGNRAKGSTEDVVIPGLPSGTYDVRIRMLGAANAGAPEPQTVTVGADGETTVTFDLRGAR